MAAGKYHILVNPAARSGTGIRVWKQVEAALKERQTDYELVLSKSGAHITDVIAKLTAREDIRLIVIGGDGTLNRVVDAITDFSHVRLGYIPAGSGNDFARDLALSADPLVLLDTVLQDRIVRRMDVGTLTYVQDAAGTPSVSHMKRMRDAGIITENEDAPSALKKIAATHRFVVSSDIGFGAAVCEGVDRSVLKRILGRVGLASLSYLFIALKIIFGTKQPASTITLDDDKTIRLGRTMMAAAMLHRYEGGGFMFAPDADPSDGCFDLCIAGNITPLKFIAALPRAMKGTHFSLDGIDHYRVKKMEVRTDAPMWLHTDGEVMRTADHVIFTCEKELLAMLN